MRYLWLAALIFTLLSAFADAEYVERIDGIGIIGDVKVENEKILIHDWDGKKTSYYRTFIRRIRSQETGKFETYKSKEYFNIYTDAGREFGEKLAADLDSFLNFIIKRFKFKKSKMQRMTIRVYSSTLDYSNHWENRHPDNPEGKKNLAFYDSSYKDVSAAYAGIGTINIVAPRVAAVYLLLKFPNLMRTNPFWLTRGWFKLFENIRIENNKIDMIGLSLDEWEDVQKDLKDKVFSLPLLFDFRIKKGTKKKDLARAERNATLFLHFLLESKKYSTRFPKFLFELNDYAKPMNAFNDTVEKKTEKFQGLVTKWAAAFSEESPWRLYYKAERQFLRKRMSKCVDILDEAMLKYPKFEDFRRLRIMANLQDENPDEVLDDIKELEKNPYNIEMCTYFRWSKTSRMPARYAHLAQRDVKRKLLSLYSENEFQVLKPKTLRCWKCGEILPSGDMNYCPRCGTPQKGSKFYELLLKRKEADELMDVLINDPRVRDAIEQALRDLLHRQKGIPSSKEGRGPILEGKLGGRNDASS